MTAPVRGAGAVDQALDMLKTMTQAVADTAEGLRHRMAESAAVQNGAAEGVFADDEKERDQNTR